MINYVLSNFLKTLYIFFADYHIDKLNQEGNLVKKTYTAVTYTFMLCVL